MSDPKELIKTEVEEVLALEQQLKDAEIELASFEQFQNFIRLQKSFNEQSNRVWKKVEDQMILNDVKNIKGDWGSITIAERLAFDTNDELPSKFYKKVVDTKKLADTFRLTGIAPKGSTPKTTKYLTKRLK